MNIYDEGPSVHQLGLPKWDLRRLHTEMKHHVYIIIVIVITIIIVIIIIIIIVIIAF